ncbi:glutathione degradosome [Hyphopichia burtonii NRRL Y-1933]|uniref:Glutathione degradosome n=1 Tax=Hyphopichia burtonii NRRL Y-1933 TaxID=984485 RepID=A0A1E4RCR0_9ASCO|nr:glutathione degradosome [Hyphopichia burtonii NRRL Y-1933]ODV65042.1 glutathione degradosome [Hyphopichia burtonii NRRL Y-1933]
MFGNLDSGSLNDSDSSKSFGNKGNIHEGEYVSIPSRNSLPINRTTTTTTANESSTCNTPIRIDSPISLVGDSMNDQKNVPSSSSASPQPEANDYIPNLIHKWTHTHSILCVVPAPLKKLIFCGTQDAKILVFDLVNYTLKFVINCGHQDYTASILCLTLSSDENFLFGAGSDSLVKVWNLSSLNCSTTSVKTVHCSHIIYSLVDIGDIFSISWSDSLSTLFIGAQNASISWCSINLSNITDITEKLNSSNLNDDFSKTDSSVINRLPHFRFDKFFDSKGPGGSINRIQSQHQLLRNSQNEQSKNSKSGPKLIEVKHDDIIRFAHNGYVYCMDIINQNEVFPSNKANDFFDIYGDTFKELLISCGGDGNINIWGVNDIDGLITLENLKSLENDESILSMSIQDSYLYVGLTDSTINVWDLMTFQLISVINSTPSKIQKNSYDEVLSLGIFNDCIFKASNLGGLIKFTLKNYPAKQRTKTEEEQGNNNYSNFSTHIVQDLHLTHFISSEDERYNKFFDKSHNSVLTIKIFTIEDKTFLILGGVRALCLWDVSDNSIAGLSGQHSRSSDNTSLFEDYNISNDDLLKSLKKYISFKTISKYPTIYLEDSRHCAQFLSKLLISLGATKTKLLPVTNANPVIYSKFTRNAKNSNNTRVLWYAHYDVVEATADLENWDSDPFHLSARDGNLFARGVSDNKGPTLAAIYAVSELYRNQELSCDVVFIIEGEEECGSIGFQDVIESNKELIGPIDWVLLSNSYWLDDETPCLNYGLRGVVNISITVESEKPDRHSGVDGGVLKEPTMDLIQILGQIMNKKTNKVNIPHFYDDVLPLTETEIEIYKKIENAAISKKITNQDLKSLMAKWRNPSLTVHKIQVSGPNNNTVIPQTAKASISIRVVPNQELQKIKNLLIEFLHSEFNSLESDNKLSINIFHEAEPWLGDPSNLVYKILYEKIKKNWGKDVPDPLFIREGGSIPSIRFLEKCFDAPAAQIPCGQASDNAHLKNEKLRIVNLYKLRSILTDTLKELGK